MSRTRSAYKQRTNARNSVRITITTTRQVHAYLKRLVPLGLHGNSVSEVAERLVCSRLIEDLKRKRIGALSEA